VFWRNLLDRRAVAEADRRAGGERHELLRQVAGDLWLVVEEQALELAHIANFRPSASSPAQSTGCAR